MKKELPKNWVETELGSYALLKNGYAFKSNEFQNEGIPVIRISNIKDYKIEIENSVCIDESNLKTEFIISKGDILIAMSGATTGKYGVFEQDAVALQNQRVGNLKPVVESLSNKKFIFYLLGFLKEEIEEKAYGAAQPNISPKLVESIVISLPPLAEQDRIVAKLDTLFAQLEGIKTAMAKVPELLKTFRQQVLTQAVTGKLTEEWREGKELESSDELIHRIIDKRLKDFELKCKIAKEKGERKPTKILLDKLPEIDPIDIDLPPKWFQTNVHFLSFVTKLAGFEYTEHFDLKEEGDIPVIRAQNVQMGRFEDKNRLYISKDKSDYLVRSQLYGREILMVFIGAGTGNVCLAPKNERWHLAPNVAKIDVDGISTEYLYLYLQSPLGVENVLSRVKATAQPSLSMETIREIVALIPPLEEQQEIVTRVESLFAKAAAIEKQYEALKAKIDTLPQAILHKAFKGELTQQLDSDGDARELLREIQMLREAQHDKGKKPTKKSTSQTPKPYAERDEVLGMVAETKENLQPKVVKLKPSNSEIYKRTLLAAEIVYQLKETNTLGHLKLQKMLYLCQEIGRMNLPMNFIKQAMGPYDNLLARSLDKQFVVKKWFEYKRDELLKYRPLENCGSHKEDFNKYFETEIEQVNYLINKFNKFTSNQIEAVATLYACWKEAISNKEIISDKLIITKFYQWSKEKEKFREENLIKALDWMRRNGIHPR